jgi:hypothetical protein
MPALSRSHRPEAVVLDLVSPVRVNGRRPRWEARFDEAVQAGALRNKMEPER